LKFDSDQFDCLSIMAGNAFMPLAPVGAWALIWLFEGVVEFPGWIQGCGAIVLPRLPLVAALFLAGLAGSVTHCATMCSGFVLGQAAQLADKPFLARLLLPYHLGRMTTYAALGVLAGSSFYSLTAWSGFGLLRQLMLSLVAVIFLAVFSERFLRRLGVVLPSLPLPRPPCVLSAMAGIARVKGVVSRFGLGVALGFSPCPIVFAALMAVAAKADPLAGGVAMAAFALGTTPGLMGIGLAGSRLLTTHPRLQDGLSLAALGINGVVLLALAAS
jgi:uncharacterized protein